MGRGSFESWPSFFERDTMPESASDKPSLKKRVTLTLFLTLPFVVLIVLMYVLAFTLSDQAKELGGETAETTTAE